jgi:hypothetical protein
MGYSQELHYVEFMMRLANLIFYIWVRFDDFKNLRSLFFQLPFSLIYIRKY